MTWILANKAYIRSAIVAFDTVLAQVPQIKANSTFQFFAGLVAKAASYFS